MIEVLQAIKFALERHAGQFRLGGEPHISHVLRVGIAAGEYAMVEMPEHTAVLVMAGVLHDVLEDTQTTDQELCSLFGSEVTRIVRALSHEEEEEPDEVYLGRIAKAGELAVLVKRFDRLDNLRALAKAPVVFRKKKLAEIKRALPIWQKIDPKGASQIQEELERGESR